MDRRFLVSLLAIIFLTSHISCGKDDVNGVPMPFMIRFQIPAGLNPLDSHFFVQENLSGNIESLYSTYNVTEDEISSVKGLVGNLSSPDNVNFEFIREVEVFISTKDNPTLQIPIFYRDQIRQNIGREIDLIPGLPNVKQQVHEGRFDITLKISLYTPTPVSFEGLLDISLVAE